MHVTNAALRALAVAALLLVFSACADRRNPVEVGTHPAGWIQASAHGKAVLESAAGTESCQTCHGDDFQGGTSGLSCQSSGCHVSFPHPTEFLDPASADFHGEFIATVANWDITTCRQCHGTDYAGDGYESKNCLTCHSQPEGPEACNTCHGSPVNAAPPEGLRGETQATTVAVGAHQSHLGEGPYMVLGTDCATCHQGPVTYESEGHIGDGTDGAEVILAGAALLGEGSGASYDASSNTCANVYCHGAFRFRKADAPAANQFAYVDSVMVGNDEPVSWTQPGSAECGSCHGLPPQGHVQVPTSTCANCHGSVVDANLVIVNKELHINGEINVFE